MRRSKPPKTVPIRRHMRVQRGHIRDIRFHWRKPPNRI